jgi:hypothetical protein
LSAGPDAGLFIIPPDTLKVLVIVKPLDFRKRMVAFESDVMLELLHEPRPLQ